MSGHAEGKQPGTLHVDSRGDLYLYEVRNGVGAVVPVADMVFRNSEQSRGLARRLIACWNACIGISTEALEQQQLIPADVAITEAAGGFVSDALLRSATAELVSALLALEQAYTNKHSPQHREACLNHAKSVLARHTPKVTR